MPSDLTPAARVAAVERFGRPATVAQLSIAAALLTDIEAAGARYGIPADTWGWVTDLPAACVDVVLHAARNGTLTDTTPTSQEN